MGKSGRRPKAGAKQEYSSVKLANTAFLASILVFALGGLAYVVFSSPDEGSVPLEEADAAAAICVSKCNDYLVAGGYVPGGPCLMNPIQQSPDWACDMVHSPRERADDEGRNQCSSYTSGAVKHLVEVSTNCELIRVK